MKVFEVTTKVEIDEGVWDDFKAFGGAVVDLFKDDPNVDTSSSTPASNTSASNTSTSTDGSTSWGDAARKKINALAGGEKEPETQKLDFSKAAAGKETLEGFKKWLRIDGPGKVKFARQIHPEDKDNKDIPDNQKRTLPPGPQEYAAQVKRLYAQGFSLRAIEVLKVWKSAASKIDPAHLAKIKAAAAAQAKAIGLN
jgi:hypothetical protein